MYETIASPFNYGGLALKNRIIFALSLIHISVVPLHVELPSVVNVVQSPRTALLQRGIGIFHLSELDP